MPTRRLPIMVHERTAIVLSQLDLLEISFVRCERLECRSGLAQWVFGALSDSTWV